MDRRSSSRLSLMRRSAPALLLILILNACVGPVTPLDLAGKWELRANESHEILYLNRNFTCRHELLSDGARKVAIGEWELTDVDRAPRVILRYDLDFDGQKSGASLNVVRLWNGDIRLSADPDRQVLFIRRQPTQ